MITLALEKAAIRRKEVDILRSELNIQQVEVQERKKEVESELSEITPTIEAAKKAVGNISSAHLNEMKS